MSQITRILAGPNGDNNLEAFPCALFLPSLARCRVVPSCPLLVVLVHTHPFTGRLYCIQREEFASPLIAKAFYMLWLYHVSTSSHPVGGRRRLYAQKVSCHMGEQYYILSFYERKTATIGSALHKQVLPPRRQMFHWRIGHCATA